MKILLCLSVLVCISKVYGQECEWENKKNDNIKEVVQFIEGKVHHWLEYAMSEKSRDCVYKFLPKNRHLSKTQSLDHLEKSKLWQKTQRKLKKGKNKSPIVSTLKSKRPSLRKVQDHLRKKHKKKLQEEFVKKGFSKEQAEAQAEEKLEREFLDFNQLDGNGEFGIFGSDDRYLVNTNAYPYNTIGYIEGSFSGVNYRGTGFLVSPHTALTNGHVVYDGGLGGYATSLSFYPGQTVASDGKLFIRPFGKAKATNLQTNSSYERSESLDHDYAAVFFDYESSFNQLSTFMPLEFNWDQRGRLLNISGYPAVVKNKNTWDQWEARENLQDYDDHLLYYGHDTSGGNSGGPIFRASGGTKRAVGIVSFAGLITNGGVRFTSQNRNKLISWLNYRPVQPPRIDDDFENNDSLDTAVEIKALDNEWITQLYQWDEDWYKVRIEQEGEFRVELMYDYVANEDVDLALYNEAGDVLAFSDSNSDGEELSYWPQRKDLGKHLYIKVYQDNAGTPYELKFSQLSKPMVQIQGKGEILLTQTKKNYVYELEGSSDLKSWRFLEKKIANSESLQFQHNPSSRQFFYRVKTFAE